MTRTHCPIHRGFCEAYWRQRLLALAKCALHPEQADLKKSGRALRPKSAFTLVELLVVMGIIVVLLGLSGPLFNSIRGANDFGVNVGTLTGVFEQARAYAVANNTYVYVGIGEFDAGQSTSASPQAAGNGRLVLCEVATRDGTRGYDVNNPAAWTTNYTAIAANLTALDKLHVFDNTHLADFSSLTPPASGNMARSAPSASYYLGHTDQSNVVQTPLAWPLGNALGRGQYNFSKVVQFDPQGVARLQFANSGDSLVPTMEIDLQPTHANIAPSLPSDQNTGDQAAVQIDCATGGCRFYRP